MNVDEFRNYLKIDKHRLDDEVIQQPELFHRIADALTEAIDQRDALKEELLVVDAELDDEIRGDFERSGDRYTEAQVKSQIRTDKKHEKAYKDYAIAKRLADRLAALKESFTQRARMLEHLCRLYATNYFETRVVQGDSSATDDVVYRQRRQRLADAREIKDRRSR